MTRNYRKEYDNYQGSTAQKKRRAMRNKARRAALRNVLVSKGDNTDIHHKDGNPIKNLNNNKSNLAIRNRGNNRSFARTKTARKKNRSA